MELKLFDLDDRPISDFANGLKRVFTAYSRCGVHSFNLSTLSAPGYDESFNLMVKIIARPYPQRYYTTDKGFMKRLHEEVILETMPEKVASDMKKFFR